MYIIADYDERYRPYDKAGRELANPTFVKLPINPKGDGLQTLFGYKRGTEVFSVWCLLLEKTTSEKNPKNRGKLLNHKGDPANPKEIAESISFGNKVAFVKYALSVLTTMRWVVCEHNEDSPSSECGHDVPPNISKDKLSKEKLREEKENIDKTLFLDFVYLTKDQHQKLIDRFGQSDTDEKIQELNDALGSKDYKYRSHYHTILTWARKEAKAKAVGKKTKLYPIPGKICEKKGCGLPAVYKDTSGNYDHYWCSKHMPEKVKELYE